MKKYVLTFEVHEEEGYTKLKVEYPDESMDMPDDADTAAIILLSNLLPYYNETVRYHVLEAVRAGSAAAQLYKEAASYNKETLQ